MYLYVVGFYSFKPNPQGAQSQAKNTRLVKCNKDHTAQPFLLFSSIMLFTEAWIEEAHLEEEIIEEAHLEKERAISITEGSSAPWVISGFTSLSPF